MVSIPAKIMNRAKVQKCLYGSPKVFRGPFLLTLIYLCGLFFVGAPLFAEGSAQTTMFAQGKLRLGLSAGYGSWNNNNYGILGAGAGYYVLDGLEAGVDGEAWLGSKPHLYSVSPEVRYTFYQPDQFKPYIGGFYKRSMYDSLSPLDSAGGRAGLVTPLSEHAFLSAGIVTEHYFNCSTSVYSSCSQTYPEIGFGLVY
jgi:hypothetical protein